MRFTQTSIRTLIIATTVAAISVVIWINRPVEPTGQLLIEFGQNGQIQLDGVPTRNRNLIKMLSKVSALHKKWDKECRVFIHTSSATPKSTIRKLIEDAQPAGLEKFSLRVLTP